MADPIEIDFGESESWTLTRVVAVEPIETPDPDRRCERCPSIAETEFSVDLINRGETDATFDLCPACVAEYTRDFDRRNIFRGTHETG